MNSYQKRMEEIKYLEQCVKELEEIVFTLGRRLRTHKIPTALPLLSLAGDDFITPYSGTGDFFFRYEVEIS